MTGGDEGREAPVNNPGSPGTEPGGSPSPIASPIAFNNQAVVGQLPAGAIGANPMLLPTKPGADLREEEAAATTLSGESSQIAAVTTQETTSVAEPSTLLLLGGGLAIAVRGLKRRRAGNRTTL